MNIDYRFTSHPQPAVILEVSDGSRHLSVTEPLEGIPHKQWQAFERSGFKNPGKFIASQRNLSEKLKQSETILSDTMRRIQTATNACDNPCGFIDYGWQLCNAADNADNHKSSRARKYATTLRRFADFMAAAGRTDIALADIDATLITAFNTHLRNAGVMHTTVAFYNRILAAIYNSAVANRLVNDSHPFADVETYTVSKGTDEDTATANRPAMTPAEIDRLFSADLTDAPDLSQAREILRAIYRQGITLAQALRLTGPDGRHLFYRADSLGAIPGTVARTEPYIRNLFNHARQQLAARLAIPTLSVSALRTHNQS